MADRVRVRCREGAEGREGRKRGEKTRFGYLSRGPQVLVTPLQACNAYNNFTTPPYPRSVM